MEIKLGQNLSQTQQLVMTPQLQHAIRLLQLSRMELVDEVRREVESNPVLGEERQEQQGARVEGGEEQGPMQVIRRLLDDGRNAQSGDNAAAPQQERFGEFERIESNKEVGDRPTAKKAEEMDWEKFLENRTLQQPSHSGKGGFEELPPIEQSLTRATTLAEHLRWQLRMTDFTEAEMAFAELVVSNLDESGFLDLGGSYRADAEALEQELAKAPASKFAVFNLGVVREKMGDRRGARQCLIRFLGDDCTPEERAALTDVLAMLRRCEDALADLARLQLDELGDGLFGDVRALLAKLRARKGTLDDLRQVVDQLQPRLSSEQARHELSTVADALDALLGQAPSTELAEPHASNYGRALELVSRARLDEAVKLLDGILSENRGAVGIPVRALRAAVERLDASLTSFGRLDSEHIDGDLLTDIRACFFKLRGKKSTLDDLRQAVEELRQKLPSELVRAQLGDLLLAMDALVAPGLVRLGEPRAGMFEQARDLIQRARFSDAGETIERILGTDVEPREREQVGSYLAQFEDVPVGETMSETRGSDDGAPHSIEELAERAGIDPEDALEVLRMIQNFDPIGVASRNLGECLRVQAEALGFDELEMAIIDRHLPNLEKHNFGAIAKDLKIPVEEVYEIAKEIQQLESRPARNFTDADDKAIGITPDVFVVREDDEFVVRDNDRGVQRLYIDEALVKKMMSDPRGKDFVKEKLHNAQWLFRAIEQRRKAIVRVTEAVVKQQREFFEKGVAYLKPMILRDIAEAVEMHESTISRVTTNKYVHTPQGLFELKYFFNSSIRRVAEEDIASESVKQAIRKIVDSEDKTSPLSDQAIVEVLEEKEGIRIARRTVAKYREMLGIIASSKRKKLF
jgi:RNA polymerase sigma-54 factor